MSIDKFTERSNYEGFEYAIVKRHRLSRVDYRKVNFPEGLFALEDESYYCGYVRIPGTLPDLMRSDDEFDQSIFCHGGITFSGQLEDLEGFWIGFDCSKLGDNIVDQDLDYVRNECKSIVDQILEGIMNESKFYIKMDNFDIPFIDLVEVDEHEC